MNECAPDREARVRTQKLRWASRRALLELDLMFEQFWRQQPEIIDEELAQRLEELLALEDIDLWRLLSGQANALEPRMQEVVALIRNAMQSSTSNHTMGIMS
ncbi:MAG: succinate dehydrogenase assembly factor 2 [Rhodocyclaceae bacterium]|nr:succinate dehydrogenase assembly factor 2 [Rhodocyclaceae bacterium]